MHVSNLHSFNFINFTERMACRFEIDDTVRRQYRRYNALGTQLTVRLLPSTVSSDTVEHFLASVN